MCGGIEGKLGEKEGKFWGRLLDFFTYMSMCKVVKN